MVTEPSEILLKLDGIPGESTDSKHKNEIDVVSYDEYQPLGKNGKPSGPPVKGGWDVKAYHAI